MGDDLPELLYRALCSAMGLSYGSDETPGYHNLSTDQRHAWEQTAAKARSELGRQFAIDMRDATVVFGAAQAVANLVEARLGK